jgi:hypothetical protein
MTGSAAGGLTGLMFVVITLVTGVDRLRRNPEGVSTFSTPTVVHFGAALLVSAVLLAPWNTLLSPAVTLGITGLFGFLYVLRLWQRSRRLTIYKPDLEDWLCYTILPLVAYAVILAGALMLTTIAPKAPFALAAGALLLVFIGIHNAWDIVTYIAIEFYAKPPTDSNTETTSSTPN